MVDAGEIFHPLRWTPNEAVQFLRDVPQLESSGVIVRMPAAWRADRPPRPVVAAKLGGKKPAGLGKDALLDFRVEVTLAGEPLTDTEIRELLAGSEGLALLRGRWVEVDRDQLSRMIARFGGVQRAAEETGLSFGQAMRMLAGADVGGNGASASADPEWPKWWRASGLRKRCKGCAILTGWPASTLAMR